MNWIKKYCVCVCARVSEWLSGWKSDFFVVPIKIHPHYIILIDHCCASHALSFIKPSYFTLNHLKYDITCTSDAYVINSGWLLSIYCSLYSLFVFHKTGYTVWNCIDRPRQRQQRLCRLDCYVSIINWIFSIFIEEDTSEKRQLNAFGQLATLSSSEKNINFALFSLCFISS